MKRRSPEEVAIFIAVLLKRHGTSRIKLTRKSIRKLANSVSARSTAWYAEVGHELAEYGISMVEVNDRYYGFLYTAKTGAWPSIGLGTVTEEMANPDFDKMIEEVALPPDEDEKDE